MIGGTAEYVALVASVVPMTWREIADEMPLAIGLQLRNIALMKVNARLIVPGRRASATAFEILGDAMQEWMEG